MQDADLALLKDAGIAAGEIAKRYFRQSLEIRDKGDGQGPVTEADLEINQMLLAELGAARPDYGWLSEESEDGSARLEQERVFIVDPIDGTRAFIEGNPTFAHALAIVERGQVIAGVVHMPMRDETYFAMKGGGAWCNHRPLAVTKCEQIEGADVLAGSFNTARQHWVDGVAPSFNRHFRPSLAYRMALAAAGRFDGMLTLRPTWEWDVAAGTLLVTEAGGRVVVQDGSEPRYNGPKAQLPGLIAGAKGLVDTVLPQILPLSQQPENPVERSTDSA